MVLHRRRLLRTLLGGAAAGLAAGSGFTVGGRSAGATEGPPAGAYTAPAMAADTPFEGVQLRVWTTETGEDRLAVIRYLLDVQATLSGQPNAVFEPIREEELVAMVRRAREPGSRVPMPHVINTGADALMALDAEGLLSDDGARVIGALGSHTFEEGALAAVRRPDGSMAAIPFHGWPQVIWARRDWIEARDDLSGVPRSIAGLVATARALHDPDRGQRGVILGTGSDFYTQQCFMMIARAFDAGVFRGGDEPTLNTPAMVAALEAYAELARYAGPGTLTWRARDYYIQGRAGLLFYSTFIMDDLAIAGVARNSLSAQHFPDLIGAPFDPDLVRVTVPVATLRGPAPGAVGAFSSINGLGLTGTGNDTERLAARTLALFLFRRDSYIAWLHMAPGGMIPVVRGVIDDDAFMRDRLGVFRMFGRRVTRQLSAAMKVPSTFSTVFHKPAAGDMGGHEAEAAFESTVAGAYAAPRAGLLYADGVVGRMVARVLMDGEAPATAARVAQGEAERLLREGRR